MPSIKFIPAAVFACALSGSAHAQLLNEKSLSLNMALAIAETAQETCTQHGYPVSTSVLGRQGQVLVALRGDGSPPHTFENSRRKAYTSLTFRGSSGDFVQRVKGDPTTGLVHLANVIAAQGGLPIKVGDEVIGAIGVSESPGGDKDEVCAQAGIDKVAAELK